MPAIPAIPKVIDFTLGSDDFEEDALDVSVVPTAGPIQSVKTLDGTTHQDAEAETWALVIRCVIDWDSARPGLAYYLFAHKGETVAFTYKVLASAISASNPQASGTVTIVPVQFGGPGNRFAEATVTLPLDGVPAFDHTP